MLVIGVVALASPQGEPRVCYHVEAEDGKQDYTVVSDIEHYKLITQVELEAGNVPKPDHYR